MDTSDLWYLINWNNRLISITGTRGIGKMNKPEKIYLNNPNLVNSLTDTNTNQGTLRETFFVNQLQVFHTINGSEV
jgi:uncharacterized protein